MITKKVLLIASIENHFLAFHIPFIKYLQRKGYEVHVATKLGDRTGELKHYGIFCHDVNFSRSPNPLAALKALMKLIGLMKDNSFSLVHVHTPMAAFLGRLAAKLTHTRPVLYTAHGFHFYKGAPWYYWAFIYPAEYLAARWTDGLIVINQEDYINAQRMGFKPNKNLFSVHGVGVNLSKISRISLADDGIRKELKIKKEDIIFTCVAGFTPNKNQLFLLKAWEKITQQFTNIHLLFVGHGNNIDNVKKYTNNNLLKRTHFLGYRKDVPQILSKSDIVVLVSKREGLPRSIMEAMALGKPLIVSNVRGNCDLVEQRKNGFLVELGDVDGLVSSMKKLITDDKLRTDMGRASLEMIRDYDIKKVLTEMSSVYDYYLKKH